MQSASNINGKLSDYEAEIQNILKSLNLKNKYLLQEK